MADLYSVIPGLQPNQQDVLEAELLAKQILEAQFPDLDLREGTGLRDLLIRSGSFLLAICKKGFDSFFSQNTLAGVTDSTPAEVVNDLMGNLFLTRKIGTYAILNARLFFARQKNVSVAQDVSFSTDGTLLFYPAASLSFAASALQFDSFSNEWYIDVDLKAAAPGADYNLSEGSLLYFSNFDPFFLHGEINYLKEESISAETNAEFIDRASTAISTRNLINKPSIDSNLRSTFNTLNNITSIGSGDPQMYRDLVRISLDPSSATTVTTILENSGTVTVTLAGHGFLTGQTGVVAGATPSGYNGSYTVTRVNDSTLTYGVLSSPLGTATVLPTIQAVKTDLYVHQAGTVDIYCDDTLLTRIDQYTLDSAGKAHVLGPVIKLERSSVSGGSAADTLPLAPIIPYTSEDGSDPTIFHATSTTLVVNDIVKVTGITQSAIITSIACLPDSTTVTVRALSHPLPSGSSLINISGITPNEYNGDYIALKVDSNTFTYTLPGHVDSPGAGTTMRVNNRGLLLDGYPSGTKFGTITSVSGTQFVVSMPNIWTGAAVVGTAIVTREPPFTLNFDGYTSRTDATINVNTASVPQTATLFMTANPLIPGRYVQISNTVNTLNNKLWRIGDVIDVNTVNIISSTPSTTTSGSVAATAKFVNSPKDFGLSQRQDLTISYGASHAGQTASLLVTYFPKLQNIQIYLDAPDNRVLCGDILARGFDVYLLDFTLVVYNTPTPTTGLAQSLINTFLENLLPGSVFVVSDLVAALNDGGITNLKTPLSITATFYQKDLFSFVPFQITDVFNPENQTSVYLLNSVAISSVTLQ